MDILVIVQFTDDQPEAFAPILGGGQATRRERVLDAVVERQLSSGLSPEAVNLILRAAELSRNSHMTLDQAFDVLSGDAAFVDPPTE
jgi:hypothetical protein